MNKFVQRRISDTENAPNAPIILALENHQLKVGIFRTFCRCGLQMHPPYSYHHRLHVAEEIATALGLID